jgi:AraC-like DNA-binding protein/Tfp pilus assembly protein PilF
MINTLLGFYLIFQIPTSQDIASIEQLLPDSIEKAENILQLALLDTFDKGIIYYKLGNVQYFKGSFLLAEKYYNLALREDLTGITRENIMNNLGVVYDLQARYDESLKSYRESLKSAEIRKDSTSISKSWINLGLLEIKTGNYAESEKYLRNALQYFLLKEDNLNIGLCYQNLSLLAFKRNQFEEGRQLILKSLSFFKEVGQKYYIAQALADQISLALKLENFELAENLLKELEILDRENQFSYQKILALTNTSDALMLNNANLQRVKQLLEDALNLAQNTGLNEQIGYIYQLQLRYFSLVGDQKNHDKTLQLFSAYYDETKAKNTSQQMEELKALYALEDLEENNRMLNELLFTKQRQLSLIYTIALLFATILIGWLIFYRKLGQKAKTIYKLNIQQRLFKKSEPVKIEDKNSLLFQNIKELCENERIYRDPELNLQKLSKILVTNPTYVTTAIHQAGDTNFSALINGFRIEEAKELILDSKEKPNFNEIADRVGFNNRVSFYRWFKEITGLSPTEFYQFSKS